MRKAIWILSLLMTTLTWANSSKTILVTGGAGFIGSNFVEYMYDKYPDYEFVVLDALTYAGNIENIAKKIRKSDRFTFVKGSVTDSQVVDGLMKNSDFVVHFAAESHVTRSLVDSYKFIDTDINGTRVMIESLIKHKSKVQRFIHISSSEVYGTAMTYPMSENHPLNPKSPYAAAKAGADRLVYSYWSSFDIPAVILRGFNNYGPKQHPEKMIPRFITQLLDHQKISIHGDGLQERDWIFVLDFCEAIDKTLHMQEFALIKNEVINIGTGVCNSVLSVIDNILDTFKLNKNWIKFSKDRPGQVKCHIADIQKAKRLLDWSPKIYLKEGIDRTINWYKEHPNHWAKQKKQAIQIVTVDGEKQAF